MANDFGRAEADPTCPVSLDVLGELYRADAETLAERLLTFSEEQRARLALYCYGKAHMRDMALTVAATCDPAKLEEVAGPVGRVIAAQSTGKRRSFGKEQAETGGKPKMKISLAGGRS
jgi:hypothetical protein